MRGAPPPPRPPRLGPAGRGLRYSPLRGLFERLSAPLSRGEWPGRLWGLLPAARRVRRVHLRLPLLPGPPGRPPLRLGFASDLHLGPATARVTLDRAMAHLAAAGPLDALLLGGDYVYLGAPPERARRLRDLTARIPARARLAVLGNHDLWADDRRLTAALASAGFRVLVNDAARLPPPHDDVAVAGLDDPHAGRPDGAAALRAAGDAPLVIGLTHGPAGLPVLAPRAALVLAGHTHGGQIALPPGRPLLVPSAAGRRWPHGLHRAGGGWLFVSRGVGGTALPVRAFAPPDVAIIDIYAAGAS